MLDPMPNHLEGHGLNKDRVSGTASVWHSLYKTQNGEVVKKANKVVTTCETTRLI